MLENITQSLGAWHPPERGEGGKERFNTLATAAWDYLVNKLGVSLNKVVSEHNTAMVSSTSTLEEALIEAQLLTAQQSVVSAVSAIVPAALIDDSSVSVATTWSSEHTTNTKVGESDIEGFMLVYRNAAWERRDQTPLVEQVPLVLTVNSGLMAPLQNVMNLHFLDVRHSEGLVTWVSWGDGSVQVIETAGSYSHTYSAVGTYTISIYGSGGVSLNKLPEVYQFTNTMTGFTFTDRGFWNTIPNINYLVGVHFGGFIFTTLEYMFAGVQSHFLIEGAPNMSLVRSTAAMFLGCSNFNDYVSFLQMDLIEDVNCMFKGCISFNQPFTGWTTSSVIDMGGFLCDCHVFNQSVLHFNTQNVTDMSYLFQNAYAFLQPLTTWVTSSVIDMSYMFDSVYSIDGLTTRDLSNFNTSSVLNMEGMFRYAELPIGIGAWDTSSVLDMTSMFLETFGGFINLSGIEMWNTSNVIIMDTMFGLELLSLSHIGWTDLSGWNVDNVISAHLFVPIGSDWPVLQRPQFGNLLT